MGKNSLKEIMVNFSKEFLPETVIQAVFSGVLTLGISVSFFLRVVQSKTMEFVSYTQLIAGGVSWDGYNKLGDKLAVNVLIFLLIILFFVFSYLLKKYEKKILTNVEIFLIFLLGLLFYKKGLHIYKSELFLIWIVLACSSLICKNKGEKTDWKVVKPVWMICLFSYIQTNIYRDLLRIYIPNIPNEIIRFIWRCLMIMAIAYTICCAVFFKKGIMEKGRKRLVILSQIGVPFSYLLFFQYWYTYRGELIRLHFSKRMLVLCVVVAIILLTFNVYKFIKGSIDDSTVMFASMITIPVYLYFYLPIGYFNADLFTYGEFTMPFQQFMSFGKIPFIDVFPVHGLCDYWYSMVDYFLFNGTYSAISISEVVGLMILLSIMLVVVYFYSNNRWMAFMLVMISPHYVGMLRNFNILPFIIIMFSNKVKNNPFRLVWWWVVLTIGGVLWYPAMGGSCAAAFLPYVIYEVYSNRKWICEQLCEKKKRRVIVFSFTPVIVAGIFFTAFFVKIAPYLLEHSEKSGISQGNRMRDALLFCTEKMIPFWIYFALYILLILVCIINIYLCKKESSVSKKLLSFLVIFGILVSSYTACRVDSCGRAVIINVILFLAVSPLLFEISDRNNCYVNLYKFITLLIVVSVFELYAGRSNVVSLQDKKVSGVPIEQDYKGDYQEKVLMRGEELGLPSLGDVYIDKEMEKTIKAVKYVTDQACGNDGYMADIGSFSGWYTILNRENITQYSSALITATKKMQRNVVKTLEERKPAVIMVWPGTFLDETPTGYRDIYEFNWIVENGYKPYHYEGATFLLRSDILISGAKRADEYFDSTYHKWELGKLPVLWGDKSISKEVSVINNTLKMQIVNDIQFEDGKGIVTGNNPFIQYAFENEDDSKEVDFITLDFKLPKTLNNCFFYFWGEEEEINDKKKSSFDMLKDNNIRIPTVSEPYWSMSEDTKYVRIVFNGMDIGEKITFNGIQCEKLSN